MPGASIASGDGVCLPELGIRLLTKNAVICLFPGSDYQGMHICNGVVRLLGAAFGLTVHASPSDKAL
jgi:hypothetical protein